MIAALVHPQSPTAIMTELTVRRTRLDVWTRLGFG